MASSTTPTSTELVRVWFEASPFSRLLGLQIEKLEDGLADVRLPFSEEICTLGDTVHGGSIGTLIDCAATLASWAGAEVPDTPRGSTVGMTVAYLAGARGEDLLGSARVLRRGKSISYVDVDVRIAGGTAVAKGLVTYKLG